MAWTEDRVDILKTMWAEGSSASQIAKELGGVTRNAVIGKVHRLGLSSRNQGKAEPAAEAKAADPKPAAPPPEAPAAKEEAPEPVKAPEAPKAKSAPAKKAEPAAPPPEEEKAEATADLPAEVEAPGGAVTVPSENQVNISEIDRDALKLTLMELTERTCKWPIGDPSRGEFYFCGHPVVAGKPYCKGHAAAAYQPMSSRRDRDRARGNQPQRPAITRSA